jgi:class 3 adenylate cyclase
MLMPKTKTSDELSKVKKLVVFSDLCSSTVIFEDLLGSKCQRKWRNLLIKLKTFLASGARKLQFAIYKFIGDGWVLLFKPDVKPVKLFRFLKSFCAYYDRLYKSIEPFLSKRVETAGVTFGMDRGTLVKVIMNSKKEFIGRPLNLASRLQAASKQNDSHPGGKVLMTTSVYHEVRARLGNRFRVTPVTRKLRNISGGQRLKCHKLWLFEKGHHQKPKVSARNLADLRVQQWSSADKL